MTGRTVATAESRVSARPALLEYAILIKPGIVAMVLISTLAGMYIAQKGLPPYHLIIWTLAGIAMSTAGAATLNNYIDRDIDHVMLRTNSRPLPSGGIQPYRALALGLALSILSAAVLYNYVNWLSAAVSTAAIFNYVVMYTLWSKRSTPLATFIGGVGGATPPVIGYIAVRPELDLTALVLFLIIFAWQHPHFWSLALKYVDEYKAAGVMNLPVARGVGETKRQIALWATILAVVSLFPYFTGMAGKTYLTCAAVSGVAFMGMSFWFLFSARKVAMPLFYYSIVHLPLLFCALLLDMA